jgi:hypothetical protein
MEHDAAMVANVSPERAAKAQLYADNAALLGELHSQQTELHAENAMLSIENGRLRAEVRAAEGARADAAAMYARDSAVHAIDVATHATTVANMRKNVIAQVEQSIAQIATIATLQADNARVLDAQEIMRQDHAEVSELSKRQSIMIGELQSQQTQLAAARVEIVALKTQLNDANELKVWYREKANKRSRSDDDE